MINNCNILLRGFLLLVSTDSEEEVRRKIRLTGFVPFFEQKKPFLRWSEPIYMRAGYVFDLRFSE